MLDRAIQTLYKFALEPLAEITADPNSYGFRPKRCVQDAIEQCFTDLGKAKSAKWVLEGDIKGCFDNISHDWILKNIPLDKKLLKKWLRSGYIETKRLFPTEKGTAQGSPISPTICNMVLDGLERALLEKYHKTKRQGKAYFPKVNFVRYADDFIVTGESKELLEEGVLPIIREFLRERGLELAEDKTVITHVDDGFDFLGCNVKWYKDKLLIKPSDKNYKAVITKIRGIIKANPTLKQSMLIRTLNPIIRGWVNFQKYNVSAKVFERLDYDIWKSLWRWCKRRHPKKSHKWIAQKYFHQQGTRTWTFSEEIAQGQTLRLIYATDTDITRFLKTKSEATAYDTKWDSYFAQRDEKRMARDLNGRKKLSLLYKQQSGICPKCAQRLTIESEYKISRNSDNQEILVHKKEKMDTDVKLERLKMAKSEFFRAHEQLEHKILHTYPKRIRELQDLLEKINRDIDTIQKNTVVDKNGQEKFSILLNGKTFTEKKEASNFISELLKKNSGSHCPLRGLSGEYKGLHISTVFESPYLHEQIVLAGQTTLRKNSSAIAGDNINRIIEMATGRDKYAKDTQTEIDDLRNKIENGKTELAVPFPQQAEFERLSLRSAELSRLLNEDVDSDERDKENLLSEKQRRMQAIFDSQPDSLCEKYFFTFARKNLNSSADDWLTSLDEKAISLLFDEGFSKDVISETILKSSPAVPSKEEVFKMVEERNRRAAASR